MSERVDFEFDFDEMTDARAGAFDSRTHAARDGDMIVLDQHSVVETEAVIATAAELMFACATEFSLRPEVSASTAQALGDVAASAFLAQIDEIEKNDPT